MSDIWYVIQHMEDQRARDNLPCSKCGGDRLRQTFKSAPNCHVSA